MHITNILGYIFIFFVIIGFVFIYVKQENLELKCIISNINGKTFCVRNREKAKDAVDLLAKTTDKLKTFIEYLKNKYPDKDIIKRLVNGFNPEKIKETLPNSKHTAYTENKKDMYFCLNIKRDNNESELIDEHTLMFVAIHEISHICSKGIGHKSEFWENFRFLLDEAKLAGIHEPIDYSNTPTEYCSTKINDNPYFEMKK